MTKTKETILVIDDDKNIRESIKMALRSRYDIVEADSGKEALKYIMKKPVDLILLDLRLPDTDGISLLQEIKKLDDITNIIMITAENSVQTAVSAMKLGAYDFVAKPFDLEELTSLAAKAIEKTALQKENIYLKASAKKENHQIIGVSAKIREVLSLIRDVSASNSTVLIHGETGVGKELVARAIHKNSDRAAKLFVAVNCSAIPENLVESELFGHEKGSFTGAHERHLGKFEIANGGTIFLDEIGTLPHSMQAKMLRVLQEKVMERVGGEKPIEIDPRVIAATNLDLKAAADEGKFREDLYYRLNVIPINVPPLRERSEDIQLLAQHFIDKYNALLGKKIEGFTPEAVKLMQEYAWPGNVRELENLIERLIVLGKERFIDVKSLPSEISKKENAVSSHELEHMSLKEATLVFEKEFIQKVLERAGGSKSKAAEMLGIHRNTLLQIEKKNKPEST